MLMWMLMFVWMFVRMLTADAPGSAAPEAAPPADSDMEVFLVILDPLTYGGRAVIVHCAHVWHPHGPSRFPHLVVAGVVPPVSLSRKPAVPSPGRSHWLGAVGEAGLAHAGEARVPGVGLGGDV
jgi:hypothetical protein